jgi:hypothetical protein
MLNPKEVSKMPLSSRLALGVALLLAGSFGVTVAVLVPRHKKDLPVAGAASGESPAYAGPARVGVTPAASTDELIKFCAGHVTGHRTFVVFKRGTCVVVNEPCQDPLATARKTLADCADPDTPFIPEPTAEGDLIVSFKEPVFQRFTRGELAKLAPVLERIAPALLSPAESAVAGNDWTPPDQAKAGLLARRRMLEDASDAVAVKIIRAKNRETAAR